MKTIPAILNVKTVGNSKPEQEACESRNFQIPVELTGRCDTTCWAGGLIRNVEVKLPYGELIWVPANALVEEGKYGGVFDVERVLQEQFAQSFDENPEGTDKLDRLLDLRHPAAVGEKYIAEAIDAAERESDDNKEGV